MRYLLRFLDRILHICHIIRLNLRYAEYIQKIDSNQKQKNVSLNEKNN